MLSLSADQGLDNETFWCFLGQKQPQQIFCEYPQNNHNMGSQP